MGKKLREAAEGIQGEIKQEFRESWKFVLAGAGVLLFGGGMVFLLGYTDRHNAMTGQGELRGAHLVVLGDRRQAIVLGEMVSTPHGRYSTTNSPRLEVIDAADGHSISRVVLEEDVVQCVAAAPGIVWCNTNHGTSTDLEVRDASTLAVVTPHAKLIAGGPPLGVEHRPQIDARSGEAWLITADGRYWHVDPKTLQAGVEPHGLTLEQSIDIGPNSSPIQSVSNPAQGAFIAPQTIVDMEGPSRASPPPLAFDQGKVTIIIHDETVDHTTARMCITALDRDGHRRWTTTVEHGEILAGWIVEHHLVIATNTNAKGFLTALDEIDGHVLWRVGT